MILYDVNGNPVSVYDVNGNLVWGQGGDPTPPTDPTGDIQQVTDRVFTCTGDRHTTEGGVLSATYRTPHQVRATGTDPSVAYANIAYLPASVSAMPNAITVRASIETTTGVHPLTWGGADSVTIQGGHTIASDPAAGVALTKGETIHVRTFVSVEAAGQMWPLGSYDAMHPDEGAALEWGADLVDGGTMTPAPAPAWGSGTRAFWPTAVMAEVDESDRTPVLAPMGSSSTAGWGDSYRYDVTNTGGQGVRAADLADLPYIAYGQGGDAYYKRTDAMNGLHYGVMAGVTHCFGNMGANDMASTRPLLATQRYAIAYWTWLAANGPGYYQATLTPAPTSTDGYTTEAGQTPHSMDWRRVDFNEWLRDGAPLNGSEPAAVGGAGLRVGDAGHPLRAVVDFSALVETAPNSGIWKYNPDEGNCGCADGLHYRPWVHQMFAQVWRDALGV